MKGNGTVDLSNPVETKGLRNLDGFGGFDVKDGDIVGTYDVDGEQRLRTVSDYAKALPLEVEVTYTPRRQGGAARRRRRQDRPARGRSYTVHNVTGKPQEVTFDDGTGRRPPPPRTSSSPWWAR